MRIAFVSDTHGDLVAFKAVISDLENGNPVDEVLMGGDLAQGGPQPAEVIDEIACRSWPSVRGNSDDFLVRIADHDTLDAGIPEATVSRGLWSVGRLGPERIEYLRSLPTSVTRGSFQFGTVVLVHATPWSTEEVVLPDAPPQTAERMVSEAGAGLLAYGHIHTPYQRRVGAAVLLSVGAVSGSNDSDPRPAYTIVELGATISVEVRRVECPVEERLLAYEHAGIELNVEQRSALSKPGPFPLRSQPGVAIRLWP
jgi:predicted phosphodiesterase